MIRAIVFDLDDTLYPENEYVLSGFETVANVIEKKYNICAAKNKLIKLYQQDIKNVYNRLLESENIVYSDEDIKRLVDTYRENKPASLKTYSGVDEMLKALKMRGYLLGIITDGRERQQNAKLDALNIRQYFDEIIISDSLGGEEFRKPDERVFLLMAQRLGVKPGEMVYVGDNPLKDFAIYAKLPIKTIQIKKGIYSNQAYKDNILPHAVVEDIRDIVPIVGAME